MHEIKVLFVTFCNESSVSRDVQMVHWLGGQCRRPPPTLDEPSSFCANQRFVPDGDKAPMGPIWTLE